MKNIERKYIGYLSGQPDNAFTNGIKLQSRRDIELMLLCLGEHCVIYMVEQDESCFPDIYEWVQNNTTETILEGIKSAFIRTDDVLAFIDRIPIPDNILMSLSQGNSRIEPICVHKRNDFNVLLSPAESIGKLFFFRCYHHSPEFNLDHRSDHLEGIVLFEIARQTCIASAHLDNIPIKRKLLISKLMIQYNHFIKTTTPFFSKSIPMVSPSGESCYITFEIVQDKVSCVKGYFSGRIY